MEATETTTGETDGPREALAMVCGWNDERPYLRAGPWAVTDNEGLLWTVSSDGRRMLWLAGDYGAPDLAAHTGDPYSTAAKADKFLAEARREYLGDIERRRIVVDAKTLKEFCDVPIRTHCPDEAHQQGDPCATCQGSGEINDDAASPGVFGGGILIDRRLMAGVIHRLADDFEVEMLVAGHDESVQFRGFGWRFVVMPLKWAQENENAPEFRGERR